MQLKLFFFLLILSPIIALGSELELVDSYSELSRMRGARPYANFANDFKCFQPLDFFVMSGRCSVYCDDFAMCEQKCDWPQIVETKFQAEECSAENVSIYSGLGHELSITSEEYQSSTNSIAKTILKAVSLFYNGMEKVEVNVVQFPETRRIIENGQMKTIMLTVIHASVFPDRTKPSHFGVVVGLDLQRAGLDQLMCFGGHSSCRNNDDYYIKRKGLLRD